MFSHKVQVEKILFSLAVLAITIQTVLMVEEDLQISEQPLIQFQYLLQEVTLCTKRPTQMEVLLLLVVPM